jgi:mRNA interferase RelE/StbE
VEWTVVLAGPARKSLKRIPAADKTRILAALAEMQQNPFQGDIRKLQGLSGFRRRVGNWRIFFEVLAEANQIIVAAIERRTSTTY